MLIRSTADDEVRAKRQVLIDRIKFEAGNVDYVLKDAIPMGKHIIACEARVLIDWLVNTLSEPFNYQSERAPLSQTPSSPTPMWPAPLTASTYIYPQECAIITVDLLEMSVL